MKGFLAVSVAPDAAPGFPRTAPRQVTAWLPDGEPAAHGPSPQPGTATAVRTPDGWLAYTCPDPGDVIDPAGSRFTVRLARGVRTRSGDVDTAALGTMLGDGSAVDGAALADLLAPWAAAHCAGAGQPVVVAGDWLGFRQLFWWQGNGIAAVSTSALALAALSGAGLSRAALGVQSLVGWQLGLGTLFHQVTKLAPGSLAVLRAGTVTVRRYTGDLVPGRAPGLDAAVGELAAVLRAWQAGYLADHPQAVLQLTGGHDSRILLGAVPPPKRPGLRALTLDTHGGADAAIAARLCALWGLRHHVHWLDEQAPLSAATAHRLALAAAARLDCMASPLALAPLALAETALEQGHRLSGLGGEVARGFYYTGQPRHAVTSPRLVSRLADWRLFTNEAVAADALHPEFILTARAATAALLAELFEGYSRQWLRATDEFYLYQRMHRWGGAHGSVAAAERVFINPMFDRRFLQLALAADPADKRDSHLLGRLMCRLDPALARIRLDSGLVPARLGRRGAATTVSVATLTARKAARKIRQRVVGGRRPQLGAAELAGLVVAHWRAEPDAVAPLRRTGLVRAAWLDELLDGRREAEPTTVAFLVNLLVAQSAAAGA